MNAYRKQYLQDSVQNGFARNPVVEEIVNGTITRSTGPPICTNADGSQQRLNTYTALTLGCNADLSFCNNPPPGVISCDGVTVAANNLFSGDLSQINFPYRKTAGILSWNFWVLRKGILGFLSVCRLCKIFWSRVRMSRFLITPLSRITLIWLIYISLMVQCFACYLKEL